MLVARLTCLRSIPLAGLRPVLNQGSGAVRSPILKNYSPVLRTQHQGHSSKARQGVRRMPKDFLEDAVLKPTEVDRNFDRFGRKFLIFGSALGMGYLLYGGLYGEATRPGAIDNAVLWPQYVKDRICSTYMYFAGTAGLTALSALAVGRTPELMKLMMRGSWLAIGASLAAMIGSNMLVRSISYEHSPVTKHLAWMLNAGVMGAIIAPLTLLGGPRIIRAALSSAGIVGGLSAVAVCAPSDQYLLLGGPMGVAFGVIFASSVGALFLPQSSVFAAGLYSLAVYGGLGVFAFSLLYDTQKVIRNAETHPYYGPQKYDPINECMGIYMDTMNIFMRMVIIMSGGTSKRK